jgi:uncharacterized protein YjbI with pentapeptide repeats
VTSVILGAVLRGSILGGAVLRGPTLRGAVWGALLAAFRHGVIARGAAAELR